MGANEFKKCFRVWFVVKILNFGFKEIPFGKFNSIIKSFVSLNKFRSIYVVVEHIVCFLSCELKSVGFSTTESHQSFGNWLFFKNKCRFVYFILEGCMYIIKAGLNICVVHRFKQHFLWFVILLITIFMTMG